MKTITRKQWKETPKDYKIITNGQHKILVNGENGTTLEPVKVKL
jgi:hypothetical protein